MCYSTLLLPEQWLQATVLLSGDDYIIDRSGAASLTDGCRPTFLGGSSLPVNQILSISDRSVTQPLVAVTATGVAAPFIPNICGLRMGQLLGISEQLGVAQLLYASGQSEPYRHPKNF